MKVLFLDIDGVCNSHDSHPNGYCGIDPKKMALLNSIVESTDCRIVLASAWRYLVLKSSMTLAGFGNMLATYGASEAVRAALLDVLPEDGSINDLHDRGKLARMWLDGRRFRRAADDLLEPLDAVAVALDDGSWPDGFDLGYEVMGIPSVRPKSSVGLTEAEAARVIELLNREAK